ncbi:hypothetical protein AVEN_211263-1 [Araneus ventricosus]|uniref:Uncharacterized protein n=1 Tax=Araneus ventricosus TaxID=182803 RepID=A0A4Y2NT94_ARAVE|nr:hypothetical protein AVEN_211263-1 [Araneus ventricosus]
MSAFVHAIAVLISELLSVCVANLCKCCFYCYPSSVFYGIFENKVSFSVILLVGLFSPCTHGLKKDLSPCVTRSMGRDMAHKIGAVSYVECSAKTKDGVKHVFEVAVQTAMGSPPSPPISKKDNKVCESRLRRLIRLL